METQATTTIAIEQLPAVLTTSTPTPVDVVPPATADQEDVNMSGMTEASDVAELSPKPAGVMEISSQDDNPALHTESPPITSEIQPAADVSSNESGVAPEATPPPVDQGTVEFATPQRKPSRDLRNIILAAQSVQSQTMYMQGFVPPSPVVAPGALHELGDIDTPNRRRSSAVGGIAGLEELRNRLDGVRSEQI
jgi:hypothetical protein